MPRLARVDIGDEIYHVINRAAGRHQIFSKAADYELFEDIILEAKDLTGNGDSHDLILKMCDIIYTCHDLRELI